MDRIQQPRVDQVSRDFANLQQSLMHRQVAHSTCKTRSICTRHIRLTEMRKVIAGRALPRQALNRQRDQRCIRLQSTMPRPAWQTISRWYLWRTSLRCFRLLVLLARTYTVQRGTDHLCKASQMQQHLCHLGCLRSSRVSQWHLGCFHSNGVSHSSTVRHKPTHAVRHHRRFLCGLATATRGCCVFTFNSIYDV